VTIFLDKKDFYLYSGEISDIKKFIEIYESCKVGIEECTRYNCDILGDSDLYLLNIPKVYEACISLGYEAFIDTENGIMAVLDSSNLIDENDIKDQIKDFVVEIVRRHPKKRKWSVWSNHKLSDGKRRKYGTHKSKPAAIRHDKMSKLGGG